jgi:hypothetical protein
MTHLKLSVGVTGVSGNADILETEGLFTQGSRPGRTVCESVGGFSKWTVLIGQTGCDNIYLIPDPTLSLRVNAHTCRRRAESVRRFSVGRVLVRNIVHASYSMVSASWSSCVTRSPLSLRPNRSPLARGLHSSTFQLNLSRFFHEIHPIHHL